MIGKLGERIVIEQATLAADGYGGQVKTWATLATVWANVASKSGNERFSEDRTNAFGMYSFTIRTRLDVNEAMRIVWRGEVYDIRHIARAGYGPQYMTLDAERGV